MEKVKLRGQYYYIRKINNKIYLYNNIFYYLIKRFDPIATVIYELDNGII